MMGRFGELKESEIARYFLIFHVIVSQERSEPYRAWQILVEDSGLIEIPSPFSAIFHQFTLDIALEIDDIES